MPPLKKTASLCFVARKSARPSATLRSAARAALLHSAHRKKHTSMWSKNTSPQDIFWASTVLDAQGNPVLLKKIHQQRNTLFLFIRHFGCFACAMQMQAVQPRLKELKQLGIQVIIIGNGAPKYIDAFKQRFNLSNTLVQIYTDPSLNVYQLMQLPNNILRAYNPLTYLRLIKAWSQGISNGKTQGYDGQMGGTLCIDKTGKTQFYFRDETVAGYAPIHEIVAAIQRFIVQQPTNKF